MVNPKNRLRIRLEGTEMAHTVAWYGTANPEAIEDTIKKTCGLSSKSKILLKDNDGDIVTISNDMPASVTFIVCDVGEEDGISMSQRAHSPGPRLYTETEPRFQTEDFTRSVRMQPSTMYPQYGPDLRPMHKHSKTISTGYHPMPQYTASPQRVPAPSVPMVPRKEMHKNMFESKLMEIGIDPEYAKTFSLRAKVKQQQVTTQPMGK